MLSANSWWCGRCYSVFYSLGGSPKVMFSPRIQVSMLQQEARFQAATSNEDRKEIPSVPSAMISWYMPAWPWVRLSGSQTAWLWKSSWKHHLTLAWKSPSCIPCGAHYFQKIIVKTVQTGPGLVIIMPYTLNTWLRAYACLPVKGSFLWEKRGPDLAYPIS